MPTPTTLLLAGGGSLVKKSMAIISSALAATGDPAKLADLDTVFESVVKSALVLVATASLVMLVIGGYQYLSAGANKEGTARAQSTLTYAVVGLVISLAAWIILILAGLFLGADFTNFTICVVTGC